jgi:DNA-binding NarL/FixJ family response regulator
VSTPQQDGEWILEGELFSVAEAAGARLRAETDENAEAERRAAEALLAAATAAMSAGHTLTEIARAETRGKESIRRTLRADSLKLVERSGYRAREAQAEHYRAIARATRLGLPLRDIAQAAQVTHGTIRSISNRMAGHTSDPEHAEDD